jgi:hypothetical protein
VGDRDPGCDARRLIQQRVRQQERLARSGGGGRRAHDFNNIIAVIVLTRGSSGKQRPYRPKRRKNS